MVNNGSGILPIHLANASWDFWYFSKIRHKTKQFDGV